MEPLRKDIFVALLTKNTPTPVGILSYLEAKDSSGKTITGGCRFSYLPSYSGPPLDPVHLNYKSAPSRTFVLPDELKRAGVFRVFSDNLPGAWGRRLLAKERPDTEAMNDLQLLAHLSDKGRTCGALFTYACKPNDEDPLKRLKDVDAARVTSLLELGNMSVALSAHELAASTIHGGARAKVAFHDVHGEVGRRNNHYIVKFNHKLDAYNSAALENTTLQLASMAGIKTVRSLIISVNDSEGKVIDHMFMTERYDRFTHDGEHEYRCHKISLLALTDARKVTAQDKGDYLDAINAIRACSTSPKEDCEAFFRRMLFNIAVNNTDDHLKNHEMLITQDAGGNTICRLAPAYDLLPIANPYPHASKIVGLDNGVLEPNFVSMAAQKMGIDRSFAIQAMHDVVDAMRNWEDVLRSKHGDTHDLEYMRKALSISGVRAQKSPFAPRDCQNLMQSIATLATPHHAPTAPPLMAPSVMGLPQPPMPPEAPQQPALPAFVSITLPAPPRPVSPAIRDAMAARTDHPGGSGGDNREPPKTKPVTHRPR